MHLYETVKFQKTSILSGTRFYNSYINDYSYIGRNSFINNVSMGKYCSISNNSYIGLGLHQINWVSTYPVFHKGKNTLKVNFGDKEFITDKKL